MFKKLNEQVQKFLEQEGFKVIDNDGNTVCDFYDQEHQFTTNWSDKIGNCKKLQDTIFDSQEKAEAKMKGWNNLDGREFKVVSVNEDLNDNLYNQGRMASGNPWTQTIIDEVTIDILGVPVKYYITKFDIDLQNDDEHDRARTGQLEFRQASGQRDNIKQIEQNLQNLVFEQIKAKGYDKVTGGSFHVINLPQDGYME